MISLPRFPLFARLLTLGLALLIGQDLWSEDSISPSEVTKTLQAFDYDQARTTTNAIERTLLNLAPAQKAAYEPALLAVITDPSAKRAGRVEAARFDVHGEKPMARTTREARAIAQAVGRYGRVWQTGSWQRSDVTFFWDRGWIKVSREGIWAGPQSLLDEPLDVGAKRVGRGVTHFGDFINCVKTRQECIAPAEAALRAASLGHLIEIGVRTGRTLNWDPEKEEILNDPVADSMLQRPYRAPWVFPGV